MGPETKILMLDGLKQLSLRLWQFAGIGLLLGAILDGANDLVQSLGRRMCGGWQAMSG